MNLFFVCSNKQKVTDENIFIFIIQKDNIGKMKVAHKTVLDEDSGMKLVVEQKHSPIVEKMTGLCSPSTPEEVDMQIDAIEYGDFMIRDI